MQPHRLPAGRFAAVQLEAGRARYKAFAALLRLRIAHAPVSAKSGAGGHERSAICIRRRVREGDSRADRRKMRTVTGQFFFVEPPQGML